MENEQPCPYCNRIHYSTYTAGRCAARHQFFGGLNANINEQDKKRQKQKPPSPMCDVTHQSAEV
jgi:hypothetical protein